METISLRQLDLRSASSADRRFFDLAFPEWSKPRRFAGGTDLGRSRYHTVVGSEEPRSDDGTLVAEIEEYWDLDAIFHTGQVVLFDQAYEEHRERLAELEVRATGDPDTMLCVFWPLHARHLTEAARAAGAGQPARVVLGLRVRTSRVPASGVVDLRRPEGRGVLLDLIRSNDFLRGKLDGSTGPDAFLRTLPALMAEQRGGTFFHQYVGRELRRSGARGLVYPSARFDAAAEVVDGELRRWAGWCFVDYEGAATPDAPPFSTFPDYAESYWTPPRFSDVARIYASDEDAYRGSFSVRGVEDDRWAYFSTFVRTAAEVLGEMLQAEDGPRGFSPDESSRLTTLFGRRVSSEWLEARSAGG